MDDTPAVTIWKNQIADYWPLHRALFNVIRKMQESEQGAKLEDVKAVAIYYCEDADFVIR